MRQSLPKEDPGSLRGFLFLPQRWPSILLAALVAALASALLVKHGFSAYDDGTYAWVMEALLGGQALHADVPWSHPGYDLWILLPFRDFLAGDILHYRYFLPPLAGITAACVTLLAKRANASTALGVGLCVGGLGFAQFSTYSASWFAVTLTACCVVAAYRGSTRNSEKFRIAWLALAGLFAGLAFGFRGPNGIAALVAATMTFHYYDAADAGPRPHWSSRALALAFFLCIVALASIADTLERALFAAPPIVASLMLLPRAWRDGRNLVRSTAALGIGFLLGIAPFCIVTIAQGSFGAMLHDIVAIPMSITDSLSGYKGYNISDLITQTLEIATSSPPSIPAWINAAFFLLTVASPVYLVYRLAIGGKPSPALILAAFSCVGVITLPNLIYAPFVWPFVLSVYLDSGNTRSEGKRRFAIVALCLLGMFVTPRGFLPGSLGWMTTPEILKTADCPLDHCSVVADARFLEFLERDVATIRRNVEPTRPLVILPSSAAYAYFVPNPLPFALRIDNLEEREQGAAFRDGFRIDPRLVIAVNAESAKKYSSLLDGFVVFREEDDWQFLEPVPSRTGL